MNFCTTSDKNYLTKGLALYNSLTETVSEPFTLFWLCLDDDTYTFFKEGKGRQYTQVTPISLKLLEQSDSGITAARNNPGTVWADSATNFAWCITPYFIWYLLQHFIEEGWQLMYVDADIYFYRNPQMIVDQVGLKPFGIHTHRFQPPRKWTEVGWFNVGVVVATAIRPVIHICDNWMRWCLTPADKNPYYKDYGTCGDQKFLELIERKWPELIGIWDEQSSLTHLAPWCTDIEEGKEIMFYHFSHFRKVGAEWYDSLKGEWSPASLPHIRPYYQQYFNTLTEIEKQLHDRN